MILLTSGKGPTTTWVINAWTGEEVWSRTESDATRGVQFIPDMAGSYDVVFASDGSEMMRVEGETGLDVLWSRSLLHRYGIPVPDVTGDGAYDFFAAPSYWSETLMLLDGVTGETVWSQPYGSFDVMATPQVVRGNGGYDVIVAAQLSYAGGIRRYRLSNGSMVWDSSATYSNNTIRGLLQRSDGLTVLSGWRHEGKAVALDVATGEALWDGVPAENADWIGIGVRDVSGDGSEDFLAWNGGELRLYDGVTGLELSWFEGIEGGHPAYWMPGGYRITLAAGQSVEGIDFGNHGLSGISGVKWNDLDGDGERDEGEPPLAGWIVYVDDNLNGRWDGAEAEPYYAVTDTSGAYEIAGLGPGTYTVGEELPAGWRQTYPSTETRQLELERFISGLEARPGYHSVGGVATSADGSFLYAAHWQSGIVTSNDPIAVYSTEDYELVNEIGGGECVGDVVVSPDGRYVYAPEYYGGYIHRYDTWNGNERSTIQLGSWANHVWMVPGGRRIVVNHEAASFEAGHKLTLIDVSGDNFSVLATLELGYAIINRAAAFSEDGSHMYVVGGGPTLKAKLLDISIGEDFRIVRETELSDELGVELHGVVRSGERLIVADSVSRKLHIVDAESFTKTGEVLLSGVPNNLAVHPDGGHLFVLYDDKGGVDDVNAVGVIDLESMEEVSRLSGLNQGLRDAAFSPDGEKVYLAHYDRSEGGVSVVSVGPALYGTHVVNVGVGQSVEGIDFGNVLAADLDFGDAPESYGTTLPEGARHVATGPMLGRERDSEPDGQPSPNADGDDTNGVDDEHGVRFLTSIIAAPQRATFASIEVLAPQGGKLDAWIDFDRDGRFEPGEHLFGGTSETLGLGRNVLSFRVPRRAEPGDSYARFRISSSGGLAPTGPADDGEVEDYKITILDGSTRVRAWAKLPRGGGDYVVVARNGTVTVRKPGGVMLFRGPESSLRRLLVRGSAGDEKITVNQVPATGGPILVVRAGPGDDTLVGRAGKDRLYGGAGDDRLIGGPGNDTLVGGPGDDTIRAGSGDDVVLADAGADSVLGHTGADVIVGGEDADTVKGQTGRDLLISGTGEDWLYGGSDEDILIGGRTAYDNDIAALKRILAEWRRIIPFDQRVADLQTPNGDDGDVWLAEGETVLDDNALDKLFGQRDQDWIIGFPHDIERD